MAQISSSSKTILITGINGYIASVTALHLLRKGYAVIGTCRSRARVEGMIRGAYKEFSDRITLVEVTDMTVPGAFDEAVKGVHGIFHAASPVNWSLVDPESVIGPAVSGATGILESAQEHAGPQLSSFVFISSGAAIIEPKQDPTYHFTEHDWNNSSEAEVQRLGNKAPGRLVYNASKAAAEKAVWKFRDENKPPFAITSVNPGTLLGPTPQDFPNGFQPNVSLEYMWGIFSGSYSSIPPKIGSGSYADVRDIADLQIWAFENPKLSADERYLGVNGPGIPQAAADILHEVYPERRHIMPRGTPGDGYMPDHSWSPDSVSVSGDKAQKAMGRSWIPFKQSVLDTAKWFEQFV